MAENGAPVAHRARVAHTLPDFARGGGQIIVLNHCRRVDTTRFDLAVIALDATGELTDDFRRTGTTLIDADYRAGEPRWRAVVRLSRLLRRWRIDLVHVHGPTDRRLTFPAALLAGVPVVCHIHSEWVHLGVHHEPGASRMRRLRNGLVAPARDRLEAAATAEYVADSAYAGERFARFTPRPVSAGAQEVPLDALDEARATVDEASVRREFGIGPGPLIVNVARLADGKGHDDILAAMGHVHAQRPDAHLLIVGDGELRGELEARVVELGIDHVVHFAGSRSDVPRLLVCGSAFVFASRTESFGLSVCEAMGAGLPLAAYRLPSLAGLMVEGQTGHFAEAGDVAGLAKAMLELLEDPARAASLGAHGRGLCEDQLYPGATAASFEAVYERVLSGRRLHSAGAYPLTAGPPRSLLARR